MSDTLSVEIILGDINAPVLDIRIYGTAGPRSIDKVFRWPVPKDIRGNANKISEQLNTNILADFYKQLSVPLQTECPNCRDSAGETELVPLQNGECVVCGYREETVIL